MENKGKMGFGPDRSWWKVGVKIKVRKPLRFRVEVKDSVNVKTQVVYCQEEIKRGSKLVHIHSTLRR